MRWPLDHDRLEHDLDRDPEPDRSGTDSKVQNIAIPAGTYDNTQLAAMLRAAINGNTTFSAPATPSRPRSMPTASCRSRRANTAKCRISRLPAVTGTAGRGHLRRRQPVKGSDVEGTIGGVAATGNGQTLTAAGGSAAKASS
jgi:flagellar hook-associated protein 2